MVYDVRDRLVFTQRLRSGAKSPMEWLVTFYDELNRPTMTASSGYGNKRYAAGKYESCCHLSQSISYVAPAKVDFALYTHDGSALYTATNSS